MRGKVRMAEILAVRLRTSLRRHYPHQVQGVRLGRLSQQRLPRTFTRSYGHKNRSQSRERVISYSLLVICKKIAADQSSPRLRLGKHGRLYT